MVELSAEVEQQLAAMSSSEFAALTARLRAPDVRERYREIAKSFLPDEASLDSWVDTVDVSKFVGADGALDEARARSSLGAIFGPQFGSGLPQHQNWGQHPESASFSSPPPATNAGHDEARRRFGDQSGHKVGPPQQRGGSVDGGR